jgi:predicted site-specific integrase-resolvase
MSESSDEIGMRQNRAVIYARFSTDLQNERSVEDQVTLCKSYVLIFASN